ncbi:MAG TPA: glycosyltransferase [Candidatus Limnocylindria bacterium]|nr:glycosyltransferase [Candidatus Limnocylindria bacterium]
MSAEPPPDVQRLVDQRAEARARRDWEAADALRGVIREQGWEPIDSPSGSSVRPLLPAMAAATGYARPEDLASLLEEPAVLDASLVTIVEDDPEDLARLALGLRRFTPKASAELVVVENAASSPAQGDEVGLPIVRLPTTARLGWADAANLGLRRARGAFIVLLDGSVEPMGEFVAPLLDAFEDASVGLAGPWGLVSDDGRHFSEIDSGEVDAVQAYCLAVRREALAAVGGFDHRYRYYRNADLDLSFAIRDRGWRAVAVAGVPLRRHEHRGWTALPDDERDRLSRRNFYRFLERWGRRPDLLVGRTR